MARSHLILADMMTRLPRRDERLIRLHIRKAIELSQRLADLDPWDKTAQSELAQNLSDGAEELLQPEDTREALGYARRSLPILETLLKSEPGSRDLQLYSGLAKAEMGQLLDRDGSGQESIAWLRSGLLELKKLAEKDPSNVTNLLELIKVQEWLSLSLAHGGKKVEARAAAEEAVAYARSLTSQPGLTPETWSALPRAYAAMGATCNIIGEPTESKGWYGAAASEWEKMIAKGLHPPNEREVADARARSSGKPQ
jgi:tetratricopeptide (TPR) repeat protein